MIRVAIDGPAGVGKSSTSKALAKYFGYAYLDTGAMYRACAWWCLKQGIDLDAETVDERVITEAVGEFFTGDHFDISVDPDNPCVFADDEDISEAIRSSEVSSHVSKVSNVIPVRNVLIAAQRAYIAREASADSFSGGLGIVAEGRDITTVVSPDAEVRVLLTAREEVRQARRTGQAVKGVGAEDVAARDKADSKVTSFLTAADGVTTIDNSDLDFAHTLDLLIGVVEDAIENQEYEQYAANLEGYELDEGDEDLISGRGFTEGARKAGPKPVGVLAVVGRPNVGKSSLVNRILGRRAAVVEDTPGVTRDRVSYDAEWAGTDFKLVDTGGWEADVEGIESAIASQAQIAVTLADAVVFVVDGQVGMTTTDERIVKMLRAAGKPVVLAVNKIDDQASEYLAAEFWKLGLGEPYSISAMHGRGWATCWTSRSTSSSRPRRLPATSRLPACAAWLWWAARTWASRLCSISWRAKNVPWSTIWPALRATPSTKSSTSMARTGCSSTRPASSAASTSSQARNIIPLCARRPPSSAVNWR